MNYKIRKAKKKELKTILNLQKICYQSEAQLYNDFNITPLNQNLTEINLEFNEKIFLVAEYENKIIGSIRFYKKDKICYIFKLIVHPDYQNFGIGSKLMLYVETMVTGCSKLELFTGSKSEKNLYLYDKLGYRITDKKSNNSGVKLVYLVKNR